MNPFPTLELTLQRKTDSGYPVVAALTRPGGFLPLRREGTLTLDIAALPELQFDPLAYGTALGQTLFVDEIRDTFVKALGDEPLRVLLSVEAPDLHALDWHRLAAPFDGVNTGMKCPQIIGLKSPLINSHLVQHEDGDAVWYFGSAEGSYHVEDESTANMKRTWVGYSLPRDWMDREQGEGHEFLHEATQVKNIWVPTGE